MRSSMKERRDFVVRNYVGRSISRMTRHGLPAAKTFSGTSRVTTLPAPITARDPMVTPGRMMAPPPTQTSAPMSTGLPNSCLRRSGRVHRVHRRIDLHRRTEQREAADAYAADIEHHAVEIEEHTLAELDVGAIVAEEWRLHPHAVAAPAEELAQDSPALAWSGVPRWR